MEHKLILGGEQYLPFARSRIKALRATGLKYATQRYIMPGGEEVRVQIVGDQEYIELRGGIRLYETVTSGTLVKVRYKKKNSYGDWSAFSEVDRNPISGGSSYLTKLDKISFNLQAAVGSGVSWRSYWVKTSITMPAGPAFAPSYTGFYFTDSYITTGGATSMFLFETTYSNAVSPDVNEDYATILWRGFRCAYGTTSKVALPSLFQFSYDRTLNANLGLKMSMSYPIYVGDGDFVYIAGGADNTSGAYTAGAGRMVAAIRTDWNTSNSTDITAQLGALAPYSFIFTGGAYLGNKNVIFGTQWNAYWKYPSNQALFLLVNATTLVCTAKYMYVTPTWEAGGAYPMPMGDESLCVWMYTPSLSDWRIVVSTNSGTTWTSSTPTFVDQNGAAMTVSKIPPALTVRRPLVKDGATIVSKGEMVAGFAVPGKGCVEFRSTDLCLTWRANGLIDTVVRATRVAVAAADLDRRWDTV